MKRQMKSRGTARQQSNFSNRGIEPLESRQLLSGGLTANYYQGSNFQTLEQQRVDATIHFNAAELLVDARTFGSPFSVQWTGEITAPTSGTYTFYTLSNSGTTLTVNNTILVNNLSSRKETVEAGKIALTAGVAVPITMQYVSGGAGGANVALGWAGPAVAKGVVPTSALTPQMPPAAPTAVSATAALGNPVLGTAITISWDADSDATGYTLQQSSDGVNFASFTTVGSGVTSYVAGGLAPNTTYFFRVIASTAEGDSSPSNVVSAISGQPIQAYAQLNQLYGVAANSGIYQIDPATGIPTLIGVLSFPTEAAGRDPYNGDVYYISTDSAAPQMAVFDPVTETNTAVPGTFAVNGTVLRAAFNAGGTFFYTDSANNLYAFNTATQTSTAIGVLTVNGTPIATNDGDIAFDPNGDLYVETGGELYIVSGAEMANAMVQGSAATQIAATPVGASAVAHLQLAFGQNGQAFASDDSGQLYSLNDTTNAITPIGAPSTVTYTDLVSTPYYAGLTITQSTPALAAGASGTFTIQITNNGPNTTIGPITVIDTLPSDVSFVSASGDGWAFADVGSTVIMDFTPNLPELGGQATLITLNVKNNSSTAAASGTNMVSVSTTTFDVDTATNVSSQSI